MHIWSTKVWTGTRRGTARSHSAARRVRKWGNPTCLPAFPASCDASKPARMAVHNAIIKALTDQLGAWCRKIKIPLESPIMMSAHGPCADPPTLLTRLSSWSWT
eukprot:3940435-Rhodomonas_salina.3